jgi:CRP-like cAMP-binding protein
LENIDPTQNLLLASLPVGELARIVPLLRPTSIVRKTVIYDVGDIIDHLYFPSGGLLAEVAMLDDGGGLEVVCIGREGAFGITALFGLDTSSHEVSVQMTGAAWRVSVNGLKRVLEDCPVLKDSLMRCFHSWFLQVSQIAVCTGRHTLSQRCANKLLNASARSGSMSLPLTHENLAHALGVRRAGITNAMAVWEGEGTIRCMRGSIEIVDVGRLRASACNCSACDIQARQPPFAIKVPMRTGRIPARH